MYFESFGDFLEMGKHGAFVWSAYGCFVLVLVVNVVHIRLSRKKALRQVLELVKRQVKEK